MSPVGQDSSDGVEVVIDALHGKIDLSDFIDGGRNQIKKIVSAPFVKRLRRIKQLGFVSQNFLSAQHNRYSHALGTIQIMRKLVGRLDRDDSVLDRALSSVHDLTGDDSFKFTNPAEKQRAIDRLKHHLLVTAAIQDVGELPYEKATARTFVPGDAVREPLRNAAVDLSQMRNKDIFSLYFIWEAKSYAEYFDGLNKTLLTFLISGLVPNKKKASPEILALREVADGHLDADRLDYVYRDAFHTIGIHHTADALIESIEDYDELGPILSHVRPVTDFIVTRAMLWSNVYLSPENRFRLILLRIALRELTSKSSFFKQFIGWQPGEITPEQFSLLDDVYIDNVIRDVHRDKPNLEREAFQLLYDGARDYEYRWVRFANQPSSSWKGPIALPHGFYWDTYADYRERNHTLYVSGSFRIKGQRYSLLESPVHLEECVGPFCAVLQSGTWPALPMPDHMAWFVRRDDWGSKDAAWDTLFKFQNAQQLTSQLELRDPLKGVTAILDTRGLDEFKPPKIFLAFAWEEKEYLERVAGILLEEHREYWALTDDSKGVGISPSTNSKAAVNEAGAVILLGSRKYVEIYNTKPDDAIHGEVSQMEARVGKIPIIPLPLDPFEELSKLPFPWKSINSEGKLPFFGGKSLREASSSEFRERVLNALKYIDNFKQR
jgi:HD superfamily phosphohydrolase